MPIESKFRKLVLIRITVGVILFVTILSFCLYGFVNPDKITKQVLYLAVGMFCYMLYLSLGNFQIYSLKILENGIEKTSLLFRAKQFIPFQSIMRIDIQKSKYKNTHGVDISEGFLYSIVYLTDGNSLIISPDSFENYSEIMDAIKTTIS
jgi:hypothetical protein